MMQKLTSAAEQAQCAVIIVGHTRKSQEGSEQDSMMGSADWINAARSSMLVTTTNDGTRIMKHTKMNWGPRGKHRAFSLDENGFVWGETYEDDDLPSSRSKASPKLDAAVSFLQQILSCGPVPAAEVEQAAKDEGISIVTLNRAKPGIAESVFSRSQHTMVWRLVADARDAEEGAPS